MKEKYDKFKFSCTPRKLKCTRKGIPCISQVKTERSFVLKQSVLEPVGISPKEKKVKPT